MPVGFQTFVDGTEIIQIDSERFTYVLKTIDNVTGSLQTAFYGGAFWIATVSIPSCINPIVFCPPGSLIYSEVLSSGTLSFDILSTVTSNLEYAVFDVGNYPTTSNIGLKLYNSLGQITFDSNLSPLLVFSSGYEEPQNINTTIIPPREPGRVYWYTGGGSYTTIYSSSEGFGEFISEDYLNIYFEEGFSQELIASGGHQQEPSEEYGPGSNFIIADMTHIVGASSGITYSISSAASVSEGSSLACSVITTNVANGTILYWSVAHSTTQPQDFSATSGSFTINSNSGSFSIPIVADATTEGPQTFSVNVSTTSGGAAVATKANITITDSSLSNIGNLSQTLGSVAISASGTVSVAGITGNLSQTLGSVAISASGTVSAGADVIPNAISWGNITGVGFGQNANQTISGINTTITLSMQNDTTPSAIVSVYVNNSFVTANTTGQTTNFTVINNDTVYFSASANFGEAPSGTVTIRNVSNNNNILNTFSINITAEGGGPGGGGGGPLP